jgi:hypothetical protein
MLDVEQLPGQQLPQQHLLSSTECVRGATCLWQHDGTS